MMIFKPFSINRRRIINAVLLFFLFAGLSSSAYSQSAYVKKYKPIADSLSKVYQIPVKVILGIAIIESGSGKSRNCKLLNNHFGMVGKNNLVKTKGIKSRYKQYATSEDSFIDFAKSISKKKYYKSIKGNPSCEKWITTLSNHGYSEKPAAWRKVMMKTINGLKI